MPAVLNASCTSVPRPASMVISTYARTVPPPRIRIAPLPECLHSYTHDEDPQALLFEKRESSERGRRFAGQPFAAYDAAAREQRIQQPAILKIPHRAGQR